jgi:hypothetical protein
LQRIAIDPLTQQLSEMAELEEDVIGGAVDGCGARQGRYRVDEVGRCVGRAAGLAVITVLVGRFTARASALNETIGEE